MTEHIRLANPQPKIWLILVLFLTALGLLLVSLFITTGGWQQDQSSWFGEQLESPAEVPKIEPELEIPQEIEKRSVTLLFGGDLQFDRYIRRQAMGHGSYEYIFKELESLFAEVDGVIANLEGPVTSFDSVSLGSVVGSRDNYIFTFSPEVVPVLKNLGFVLLNLGNNHILNFGQDGLEETKQLLDDAQIGYWGNTGGETWLDDSFYLYEQHGVQILFVNYNEFLFGDREELLVEMRVRKERLQPDFMVVYTHWGTEYQQVASEYYQDLATELVIAGADMIIGSHPHVIQQHQQIGSAMVYYSLGNFVFDQYFETAVRKGTLLKTTFTAGEELSVSEVPIFLEGTGKTVLE